MGERRRIRTRRWAAFVRAARAAVAGLSVAGVHRLGWLGIDTQNLSRVSITCKLTKEEDT